MNPINESSKKLGKRKRSTWSEEILNDGDVAKTCDYGKWIECKVCKKMLTMQSLYGSKNWKIHKDALQHKRNAGKKCLSITKFFGPVEAEEKTNATGSVAPFPKQCPGIYNPKKSNRLLKLMMMYGEKTDAVRIACTRGKFVAKVVSCEGETVIRSSACRNYYRRCCKSCFDSLGNRNSEANKFLRRVESMDVVEKCVDLLSQGELKDYDIKVLKKVLNWKQRDNRFERSN